MTEDMLVKGTYIAAIGSLMSFWDIENDRNLSVKTAYEITPAFNVKLSELLAF